MASEVQIANRALSKLGATRIVTFDDGSKQARFMKANYEIIKRAELRKHLWSFAKRRASLAALTSTPEWGYTYEYQLPDGCLRVIQVNDYTVPYGLANARQMDDSPYKIEGNKIRTDYKAPLKIIYLVDVTEDADFDALFVESLASKLAMEGCEEITGSDTKWQKATADYRAAIKDAISTNSIEQPAEPLYDDSWLLSRF